MGHMLANPLGEPDHHQAFAAALGVPEDACLAAIHMHLRRSDAEILVVAADLLGPCVEDDEVVDDLQQALLAAELSERPVQRVLDRAVFFPGQVVLLRCLNHPVAQPFGVVARHHKLHGGEEGADKFLLLVVEVLADAFGDGHDGTLQFEHAQSDAVDVQHEVGSLGVFAHDGDLFGDGEVVVGDLVPVDEPDGDVLFVHVGFDFHTVAQQAVDLAVGVVERLTPAECFGFAELVEDFGDNLLAVTLAIEPVGEQPLFDVAVALAVLPVAEVVVSQFILEELDDVLLRQDFLLADLTHRPLPLHASVRLYRAQSALVFLLSGENSDSSR